MSDAVRRALRTLFQFIVSGGLTALVNVLVDDLSDNPLAVVAVLGLSQLVVTFSQNELEDRGAIAALLKAPASSGANPIPEV